MTTNVHSGLELLVAAFLVCVFPFSVKAQEPALPWLENIGAEGVLADIHTISAEAAVTVSDGVTYTAHTVFHDGHV